MGGLELGLELELELGGRLPCFVREVLGVCVVGCDVINSRWDCSRRGRYSLCVVGRQAALNARRVHVDDLASAGNVGWAAMAKIRAGRAWH
jgi:hypothetical protein